VNYLKGSLAMKWRQVNHRELQCKLTFLRTYFTYLREIEKDFVTSEEVLQKYEDCLKNQLDFQLMSIKWIDDMYSIPNAIVSLTVEEVARFVAIHLQNKFGLITNCNKGFSQLFGF